VWRSGVNSETRLCLCVMEEVFEVWMSIRLITRSPNRTINFHGKWTAIHFLVITNINYVHLDKNCLHYKSYPSLRQFIYVILYTFTNREEMLQFLTPWKQMQWWGCRSTGIDLLFSSEKFRVQVSPYHKPNTWSKYWTL
jgi:Iap family predicted aminopeptidase